MVGFHTVRGIRSHMDANRRANNAHAYGGVMSTYNPSLPDLLLFKCSTNGEILTHRNVIEFTKISHGYPPGVH